MKSNVPPDSTFPWMPSVGKPIANDACSSCSKFNVASHKSCVGFKVDKSHLPSDDQRLSLNELIRFQAEVRRKGRDSEGFYGSAPGFLYNARDSYNYSDFNSAALIACGGYTLTLDFGAVDPRGLVQYQARKRNVDEFFAGMFWVVGYGGFGPPQPWDVIEYSSNSILSLKSRPTIKEILNYYYDGSHKLVVRVDQATGNAMTNIDPDAVDPVYSVKIWNQDGNKEDWQYVQHPTYLKCRRKVRPVVSSSLPEDKILHLEDVGVAHPPGFHNSANSIFLIEGKNPTTGHWDVVPSSGNRLFTRTFADGSRDAVVALGSQKPSYGNDPETPVGMDLTTVYAQFRITYWYEHPDACEKICHSRCKHSRRDYHKNVDKYNPANGVGVDSAGNRWYCDKRKYDVDVLVDEYDRITHYPDIVPGSDGIPDGVVKQWRTAGRVADYPQHGQCLNHNTCPEFEPAEGDRGNMAQFRYEYHPGVILRDLWGAVSTRLRQLIPGFADSWNFVVERVKHHGLQYLAGMHLQSFPGMHPRITFIGGGGWSTKLTTLSEPPHSERIHDPEQHNYDWVRDPVTTEHTISDGDYPSEVAGFKTYQDPLNPSGTVQLNEIERVGIRNLRDDGEIIARGLHRWPKVLPPGQFIVPNVSTIINDVQDRDSATFVRYAA